LQDPRDKLSQQDTAVACYGFGGLIPHLNLRGCFPSSSLYAAFRVALRFHATQPFSTPELAGSAALYYSVISHACAQAPRRHLIRYVQDELVRTPPVRTEKFGENVHKTFATQSGQERVTRVSGRSSKHLC
jgi:hypothetical protein